MRFALLAILLAAASCTKPNPLDCADGNCTDPAHPFCDVDGSISGQPDQCIAITCTPMAFQECRNGNEIRCDETGTNYTVTACQHTCDPTLGCLACTSNADCTDAEPTCDMQTHTCRTCVADADCTSNLCEISTGTCHDQASIIYVTPSGSPTAPCGDMTNPCTMVEAFNLVSATKNAIKLAPTNYTTTGELTAGEAVTLYGAGATLHANGAAVLDVSAGGQLTIRDLAIQFDADTPAAITCSTSSSVRSKLDIDNLTVTRNHATTGAISSTGCDVLLTNSHLIGIQTGISALKGPNGDPSMVAVDRSVFDGANIAVGFAQLDPSMLALKNSLVLKSTLSGTIFATFATLVDSTVSCQMFGSPHVDDSIIYSSTMDTFTGTPADCVAHYDLISQLGVPPNGNHLTLNADPKFTNAAMEDFHLSVGSPAIDAADPTAQDPYDLDGTTRPQGAADDMGAYEYH